MNHTPMSKNPLTGVVALLGVSAAYDLWQAFATQTFDAFDVYRWIQAAFLIHLYFRKSPFAGRFLFYSLLPLFPLYFGLQLMGLTEPPSTPLVYWIASILYAIGIPIIWHLRGKYDRFIAKLPTQSQ